MTAAHHTPDAVERRDHALNALKNGQSADLDEIGWTAVFRVVEAGWTIFADGHPVSHLPLEQKLGWVSFLGYHPPAAILQALRMWPGTERGDKCPRPAEIHHLMTATVGKVERSNVPPELSAWRVPSVLLLVAGLIEGGEPVCDCSPAPMTFLVSRDDVLRCAGCEGLEYGQASEAIDHVLPPVEVPVLALVDDGRPAAREAARKFGESLRELLRTERTAA